MSATDAVRGMFLPLPTVFDGHGQVDEPVMRDLTQFYVEKGIHSFFVCGSYGQGPALSTEQRMRVAEMVVEEVRGRRPVVIHIGAVDPYTAIELGLHARKIGAEAVGSVGPYYYSDRSHDELVMHFQMVDQAVQLPMVIYNNPGYQGYQIGPALMQRLVQAVPRIWGAKLAMGGLEEAFEYTKLMPGFAPYTLASTLVPGMQQGVRGTVSPPLSLTPELGVDLVKAIDEGREDEALRLQERATEVNDILLKQMKKYGRVPYTEGLRALGFNVKQYPRWPTVEMAEEDRQQVADLVKRNRPVGVA